MEVEMFPMRFEQIVQQLATILGEEMMTEQVQLGHLLMVLIRLLHLMVIFRHVFILIMQLQEVREI